MIRVAALLSVTSLLLLKMPDASRIMTLFAKFIDCLRFFDIAGIMITYSCRKHGFNLKICW